ncbi:MAG: YkgJ family cysteine cluster protein [Candidatus Micrarchaeia archaeon]
MEYEYRNATSGPCARCDANCCKNYIVCITANDLLRLADYTKSTEWADAVPSHLILNPPTSGFFLYDRGKPVEFFLCLKRDNRECCVFLNDENLCSVYEARPLLCRAYPFEKSGSSIVYKKNFRCPSRWELDKKTLDDFTNAVKKHEEEAAEYGKWCREWNALYAKEGTFEGFINFLIEKARKK